MRYKVVPEPPDRALAFEVAEALPLVPDSVEDCCTRIRDRTAVPSRDAAREWLTFIQALGLAVKTSRGFHRPREFPNDDAIADAFEANVFGVDELVAVCEDADEPLTVDTAFRAIEGNIPRWERDRYGDWESEWRERVDRLLQWGVELGVFEETAGGYGRA